MVAGSFHVSNTVVCFEAKSVQIRIVYRLLCIGNLTLHVPAPFVSHTWQQCRKCSLWTNLVRVCTDWTVAVAHTLQRTQEVFVSIKTQADCQLLQFDSNERSDNSPRLVSHQLAPFQEICTDVHTGAWIWPKTRHCDVYWIALPGGNEQRGTPCETSIADWLNTAFNQHT